MSKVQERGLMEALGEAEGLANVLRAMSGGKIDLLPLVADGKDGPLISVSWQEAKTGAKVIAGTLGERAVLTRVQETFCSNCGCLDEPGVHSQPDCPRYG